MTKRFTVIASADEKMKCSRCHAKLRTGEHAESLTPAVGLWEIRHVDCDAPGDGAALATTLMTTIHEGITT